MTIQPPNPKTYSIDLLPGATLVDLRAKEEELDSLKSWRGTAKLVASAALVCLGIAGALFSIFNTLIIWVYGFSIITIGIGGASFQKFWADQSECEKTLEDMRLCQADLAIDKPFRRFLESGSQKELTWIQINETHKQFKKATACIN